MFGKLHVDLSRLQWYFTIYENMTTYDLNRVACFENAILLSGDGVASTLYVHSAAMLVLICLFI